MPVNWSRMTVEDMRKMKIEQENAATKDDYDEFKKLGGVFGNNTQSSSGSGGKGSVAIKTEKKYVQDVANEKFEQFKENRAALLRSAQDDETEMTQIYNQLASVKYCESFRSDIEAFQKRLAKAAHILKRMLKEMPAQDKVMTFLTAFDRLVAEKGELLEHATKLGVGQKKGKRARKPKDAEEGSNNDGKTT